MIGGRRCVTGVVLAAALLLTSCTDDESPPVKQSPSMSVPPVTPAVTATKPAQLTGQPTAESAVEFAKYFLAVYNYAYSTYDTAPLVAISRPECKYCTSVVENVRKLEQGGTRVEGTEVEYVDSALTSKTITTGTYLVVVTNQHAGRAVSEDGTSKPYPGAKGAQLGVALDWDGGAWFVRGAQIQDKGVPWGG